MARMTNHKVHQANELRYKKDESKDNEAQEGVGDYFASNISIKQAHSSAGHILASGADD